MVAWAAWVIALTFNQPPTLAPQVVRLLGVFKFQEARNKAKERGQRSTIVRLPCHHLHLYLQIHLTLFSTSQIISTPPSLELVLLVDS